MLLNNKNLLSSLLVSGLTLLGSASSVQADSERIKSNANNHWYQLFTATKTWPEAKAFCISKSAHLATIDSQEENGFIANSFVGSVSSSWIGGNDVAQEGKYVWGNGEKWGYTNWASGYPLTGTSYPDWDYAYFSFNGLWLNERPILSMSFICEWSNHNFVDVAYVPDLNNNRISETAALYVDFVTGKHTVKIKDPQTQKVLNILTFLTSFTPPQGLVSLVDISGNRVPEIAVLYSQLNQPSVGIKDAKNNGALLKTIRFLGTGYEPKAITATPDANGNGSNEITVLGISKANGAAVSETRDSKTGALLKKTTF